LVAKFLVLEISKKMTPGAPAGIQDIIPGGTRPFTPDFQNVANILNIRNLLPIGEGSATDSVFDLVKDDTFVRKIKKSSYNEIVAKLEGTG
jgi:hypothetical protein